MTVEDQRRLYKLESFFPASRAPLQGPRVGEGTREASHLVYGLVHKDVSGPSRKATQSPSQGGPSKSSHILNMT